MDDGELAERLGFKSQSEISTYKKRETPPHAERVLIVAKACGVDPGWLAFGEETAAPAPEGFATWIENRRARTRASAPLERKEIPAPRPSATKAADKAAHRRKGA